MLPTLQGFWIATLTVGKDLNDALRCVNLVVIYMFEKTGFQVGKGLRRVGESISLACRLRLLDWDLERRLDNWMLRHMRKLLGMNKWFVKEGEGFSYYGFS